MIIVKYQQISVNTEDPNVNIANLRRGDDELDSLRKFSVYFLVYEASNVILQSWKTVNIKIKLEGEICTCQNVYLKQQTALRTQCFNFVSNEIFSSKWTQQYLVLIRPS